MTSITLFSFLITLIVITSAQDGPEPDEMLFAVLGMAKDSLTNMKNMIDKCEEKPEPSISECYAKIKKSSESYIELTIDLIKLAKRKYIENDTSLETAESTVSPPDDVFPMDCQDILESGKNESGVYTIQLRLPEAENKSLDVFCDMETNGGGWTVIQRRGNYDPQESFRRIWEDYKNGFGNITRDFWLGNDNIYFLTNQENYSLWFDLEDRYGETRYALYDSFRIENETNLYRLSIGEYSGNAGDSMEFLDGMNFSTIDRRHDLHPAGDESCASVTNAGWWFDDCTLGNPNGAFLQLNNFTNRIIFWYDWKGYEFLPGAGMKIRRTDRSTEDAA